ncbi:predicted GPI-anchored protein 58 [Cryptomeria japonica]|uniref:predicted GPI-anchored protein 58 n=1 Tax=Cryptomeria japonica TaxID=3369 RepID=UPI0027DA3402|nr:predicted GPI-anchored protein 58 [Cryptomeria japonica]
MQLSSPVATAQRPPRRPEDSHRPLSLPEQRYPFAATDQSPAAPAAAAQPAAPSPPPPAQAAHPAATRVGCPLCHGPRRLPRRRLPPANPPSDKQSPALRQALLRHADSRPRQQETR